jgi:D-sedoheptulose 7-phosphate isomerase
VAAGFGGRGGGRMNGLADPFLLVPSDDTARIQEMHITLGHMLCSALEQELGLL